MEEEEEEEGRITSQVLVGGLYCTNGSQENKQQ
jgi:hypothetical protein